MDVIKLAGYIIDIGPEGGKGGGQVVTKEPQWQKKKKTKSYSKILEKLAIESLAQVRRK
jgi:excinuclease ABC subunit A